MLAAWGDSNTEIAKALGISVKTVEIHKSKGMRSLGLTGRRELIRYALAHGWFDSIE
jgi:DNA-binding NarL/FixJ family response regulator